MEKRRSGRQKESSEDNITGQGWTLPAQLWLVAKVRSSWNAIVVQSTSKVIE